MEIQYIFWKYFINKLRPTAENNNEIMPNKLIFVLYRGINSDTNNKIVIMTVKITLNFNTGCMRNKKIKNINNWGRFHKKYIG